MLAPYRGALLLAVALLLCESVVMLTMPWFAGRVAQALLGGVVPGELLLACLGVVMLLGPALVSLLAKEPPRRIENKRS